MKKEEEKKVFFSSLADKIKELNEPDFGKMMKEIMNTIRQFKRNFRLRYYAFLKKKKERKVRVVDLDKNSGSWVTIYQTNRNENYPEGTEGVISKVTNIEKIYVKFEKEGRWHIDTSFHERIGNNVAPYLLTEIELSEINEKDYLEFALKETAKGSIDLELLFFDFNDDSLKALLDAGIRWFATDFPQKLSGAIDRWKRNINP